MRYQYLTSGTLPNGTAVYATILAYPFTEYAKALPDGQRPNILATISDFIQPFSSSAVTVAASSLSDTSKRDVLTRFLAALYAANNLLAAPENEECATEAIAKELNVTNTVAHNEYMAATNVVSGESISAAVAFNVSRLGLLNVIDVRGQFSGFSSIDNGEAFNFVEAIEPGIGKMIDYSVRDDVVSRFGEWANEVVDKGMELCNDG